MTRSHVVGQDIKRGTERIGTCRRVLEEWIERGVRVDRCYPDEVREARLDDRVRVVGAEAAGRVAEFTEVGRHFSRNFRFVEPELIVTRARRNTPEHLLELLERKDAVVDRGRVGIEAVVA